LIVSYIILYNWCHTKSICWYDNCYLTWLKI
jgi:hypothetical protein